MLRVVCKFIVVFGSLLLPCVAVGSIAAAEAASPDEPTSALRDIGLLIKQLDDERFDVRRQAAGQLEALVAREELGPALAAEFQRVLLRADVSFEVRWQLERWICQLPASGPPPAEKLTPEEAERLVAQLADDSYAARISAERRLEAALYRDDNVPVVGPLLEARLAERPGAELAASLGRLLDLTRPAMVAEYWENQRHQSEQYLLIGVPSMGPGAARPSHFDRIDDQTAHCASGSSLAAGDYPVGVAIPHPKDTNAFFRLVNLPTPLRRREYGVERTREDGPRLAELSRRTLDRLLAERRPLTTRELLMLWQLDAEEVSRFAGKYFLAVDDAPMVDDPELANAVVERARGGRPSVSGMICAFLASQGTQAAVPGLLAAIEKDRFLPPTTTPYWLHWGAAMAIARRDPWPDVEDWLASVVGRDDPFIVNTPDGPQVGESAAAILLERHGQSTSQFGLMSLFLTDSPLGTSVYEFQTPDNRTKFDRWWREESKKPRQATAASGE